MTETKNKTHLQVGRIGRPHGIRGEMKVRLHFNGSSSLAGLSSVVIEQSGAAERYEVESLRGKASEPILALVGTNSREGADKLKGGLIWIPRSALEPLPEGEYYLVDLVGCEVHHGDQRYGEVRDVRPDPSVDTLIIQHGDSVVEQPLLDAFVSVDTEARRVELLSLDGIID